MIGTKIHKNNKEQMNNYAEIAVWCNETQAAFIEDKGDYFEVVEIPGPTLEESKEEKLNKAGELFAKKRDVIRWITVSDGNTYGFDCENEDITNFFAAWKAAEKFGSTNYKAWITETQKGVIVLQFADFDAIFDIVRSSQLEAYAWYEKVRAKIKAAKSANELKTIILK